MDILSGGYPCIPFSSSGKKLGKLDHRHLWPHFANGISICRPRLCVFENVFGHVSMGLSSVVSDLEEMGYAVQWGLFGAEEVGAPHVRKRVFVVASNSRCELQFLQDWRSESAKQMPRVASKAWRDWKSWPIEPSVCGSNDGPSHRLDELRLCGNSVVPDVAELAIGKLLNDY